MSTIKLIIIADNKEYLRQSSVPVNLETDKNCVNNIDILEKFCGEN